MGDRTTKLLAARNKIKKEIEKVQLDNKEFKNNNKKFNKTILKIFLVNCLLILPMALYTIPIIPTTTTIAGMPITGLTPILPKSIPLDLLIYPAFVGSFGLAGTVASFGLINILYYIPAKILGKKKEYELENKKQELNRIIIQEYKKNKNSNLQTNNQTKSKIITKHQYQYNNSNNNTLRKEDYKANNKVKKRNLLKY